MKVRITEVWGVSDYIPTPQQFIQETDQTHFVFDFQRGVATMLNKFGPGGRRIAVAGRNGSLTIEAVEEES